MEPVRIADGGSQEDGSQHGHFLEISRTLTRVGVQQGGGEQVSVLRKRFVKRNKRFVKRNLRPPSILSLRARITSSAFGHSKRVAVLKQTLRSVQSFARSDLILTYDATAVAEGCLGETPLHMRDRTGI